MLIVGIKNGNIEVALKEYKRKIQKVKQVEELKKRKEFKKKSVQKRLQIEEAKRKNKYSL